MECKKIKDESRVEDFGYSVSNAKTGGKLCRAYVIPTELVCDGKTVEKSSITRVDTTDCTDDYQVKENLIRDYIDPQNYRLPKLEAPPSSLLLDRSHRRLSPREEFLLIVNKAPIYLGSGPLSLPYVSAFSKLSAAAYFASHAKADTLEEAQKNGQKAFELTKEVLTWLKEVGNNENIIKRMRPYGPGNILQGQNLIYELQSSIERAVDFLPKEVKDEKLIRKSQPGQYVFWNRAMSLMLSVEMQDYMTTLDGTARKRAHTIQVIQEGTARTAKIMAGIPLLHAATVVSVDVALFSRIYRGAKEYLEGTIVAINTNSGAGMASSLYRINFVQMEDVKSMVSNVLAEAGSRKIPRLIITDHGGGFGFHIGKDLIERSTLSKHREELSRLRGHFTENGYVRIKGCMAAQYKRLFQELAKMWGVPVYGGTGLENAVFDVNAFGQYIKFNPDGTIEENIDLP